MRGADLFASEEDCVANAQAACAGTARAARLPWHRSSWRRLRVGLHVCEGLLTVRLLYPLLSLASQQRLRQAWSRRLLAILAVEVRVCGRLQAGALLVANHISWLDIFVINAIRPTAFVAKAEVRRWPLAGWLAAKNDTVFLQRGRRSHAHTINHHIGNILSGGRNVAVFPEGTTSDGKQVLPFHAALLQPAIAGGHCVQALALRYQTPTGAYCGAPAYDGDISFGQCLNALLRTPHIVARIDILPAQSAQNQNRRALALASRQAIAARVCALASPAQPQPPAPPANQSLA